MTHTKTERMILQTMQHPFLMTLQFAFQSEDKLYMVLEYMKGGELFHWLRQAKRFTEDRAKLYGAEILLALAHLHSHDIVYRDLKPENILMDEDGHLRLTDFGLSKESVSGAGAEGGTKTFCGTPEYLAPEILENRGHGKAVDWWSLGVLIYEMMVGRPPFYDKNMQKMYSKVRGERHGEEKHRSIHIYIYIYIYIYMKERGRERERDTHSDRDRDRHRDTETQRHRDTETQREEETV